MSSAKSESSHIGQLRRLLVMADAKPTVWVSSTVVISVLLALLDVLGIAAMIPLTQVISGVDPSTGVLGVIADAVGTTSPTTLIPIIAATIAGLFVAKSLASVLFRWWLLGRTTRVSALVATNLMRQYVLAPYADHRGRRLSEVYRNVNDATGQAASVLLASVGICTDVLMLGAIVVVLAITSPLVTLLTVALFAGFVFGLQRVLRRTQSRIGEEMAQASLTAWQFLMPALDGFREARLTSSASTFIEGFGRARLRGARAGRLLGIIADVPRYSLEIVFVVAIMGISLILFATGDTTTTLTVLGVFAAAALRALPSLNRVSANLATIRVGGVGLRIVLSAADELSARGTHHEVKRDDVSYDGDIVFEDVSFRYQDASADVLSNLVLTIEDNKTTAFVGSSGAGKSTLLDLVLGLQDPTTGTISCGGLSILDDKAGWYATLGVVSQDVFLTNDTVMANIAFGVERDRVDETRVGEVVGMTELTELIAELPDGLATVVGERGVRLSGGQRQRLGLARALYRRPRVLVLDEATSALDNATEHEITETLRALKGTMTILIVAHRLSTVRAADTLVFLKDGRIEDVGTFERVRSMNADFARLVQLGELS